MQSTCTHCHGMYRVIQANGWSSISPSAQSLKLKTTNLLDEDTVHTDSFASFTTVNLFNSSDMLSVFITDTSLAEIWYAFGTCSMYQMCIDWEDKKWNNLFDTLLNNITISNSIYENASNTDVSNVHQLKKKQKLEPRLYLIHFCSHSLHWSVSNHGMCKKCIKYWCVKCASIEKVKIGTWALFDTSNHSLCENVSNTDASNVYFTDKRRNGTTYLIHIWSKVYQVAHSLKNVPNTDVFWYPGV